ncbi:hypothetical protein [Sporolactobacillus laevolacticus]|uniref:Uncharacterized protein n=1 Tax=Sporolactobacillus laevolacticus DSM 442 TaxID=1395513 RepID=V6IZI2_9BACL|nr:hypothetical protein [Sporolactobacillus laevolacticus]EST12226.1 hypothetical protein P343_08050 [Sporolactobacillus laevolacticus DSM 442]
MNLFDHYLFKDSGITLFDTLLVSILSAVIGVFLTSMLKAVILFLLSTIKALWKFIKRCFKIYIPHAVIRFVEWRRYRQNLRDVNINESLYIHIRGKQDKGTISRLEKKALDAVPEEKKKTYEQLYLGIKNFRLEDLPRPTIGIGIQDIFDPTKYFKR